MDRVEVCGIQIIQQVLAKVQFTVCPLGQQTHLKGLKGKIGIKILNNCLLPTLVP